MKAKWIGVLVVLALACAMPSWADVKQEDVNKLVVQIIKQGTPKPENLMIYVQMIEPGTVEMRYYASVWFVASDKGLVPTKMILSEEAWAKGDGKYGILQYIVGDFWLDGVPDAGMAAILIETVDGSVLSHETKALSDEELKSKYEELFYKFFLRFTGQTL